jgi:pyrroloquinoline quinone biosynthesis protein D
MDTQIQHADIYALSHHHRFQWEEAQNSYVILFPEGMVKLHGGAGEVLKRVDGKATVGDIVADLKVTFPAADDIESDIIGMF